MKITYEKAAKEMTLEQAINTYKHGIATIITDGRDVTFEIENVSTSEERKKKADQSQQL